MKPTDIKNFFTKLLHSSRSGFTLLELIVVIGIVAILGTVSVIVLNPAQMFKQTRDINRITDIQNINNAMVYYQATGGSSFGTANTIYVSLPSAQSDCSDLGLPTPPGGWSYACKPSSSYRNINGTGWIPVDFTSAQGTVGALFSALPIDPVNTLSGDYYYTYIYGTWTLSATMESTKYIASKTTSDGGSASTRFEVGNDLALNSNIQTGGGVAWACGSILADTRDGKNYNTVLIGSQCWFAQDINVGTLTAVANTQGTSCSSIQKHCYSDTESNCTSYGGLYQWNQAMCGSTSAGAQGICPTGWHIPTHDEWTTLERSVCTAGTGPCATTFPYNITTTGVWLGATNEGSKLSMFTSGGTNSSGFTGLLAGYTSGGSSNSLGVITFFWSSVESGADATKAWIRSIMSAGSQVHRDVYPKAMGFPLRCLKN